MEPEVALYKQSYEFVPIIGDIVRKKQAELEACRASANSAEMACRAWEHQYMTMAAFVTALQNKIVEQGMLLESKAKVRPGEPYRPSFTKNTPTTTGRR